MQKLKKGDRMTINSGRNKSTGTLPSIPQVGCTRDSKGMDVNRGGVIIAELSGCWEGSTDQHGQCIETA